MIVAFAFVLATPLVILALLAGLMILRLTQAKSVAEQVALPTLAPQATIPLPIAPTTAIAPQSTSALPGPTATLASVAAAPLTNSTGLPTLPSSAVATIAFSGGEGAGVTPAASATPPAAATIEHTPTLLAPTPTTVVAAPPTSPPTLTPAPTATPSDWTFANVQVMAHPSQNGLIVVGEIVNHTGVPQDVLEISGEFYDAQGRFIAGRLKTTFEIPTNAVPVPAGGRMPFEMHVLDIDQAASYSLEVRARASTALAREFDDFINSTPVTARGRFCINSTLLRPEPGLNEYLAIALLLLDGDGRAIGLGRVYEPDVDEVMSTPAHSFQICADDDRQDVAGFLLRAWGR